MAATHTNETVFETAGIDTSNLEFPDLEIPVLAGIQRQGDLIVLPCAVAHARTPIGDGVTVVEPGIESANSHILVGDGLWEEAVGDDLVEGWFSVPDGGEAFLIHTEEHNALGIGPGNYEVRRQREWDAGANARQLATQRAEEAQRLAYRRIRD